MRGFDWREFLRENWFYLLVFFFLFIFPHLVGWVTGDSPFGRERGSRIIMLGESTKWQAVFIEIFALSILVMSYNLMFGFTGVISFGHALFFGLGGYVLGVTLEFGGMDPTLGFFLGVLIVLALTGIVSFLMGLATLRLSGIYFAIFTLALAEMAWIFVGRWELTNGEDGLTIAALPEWIDPARNRLLLYYVALFAFVFTFLFIRRLVNSPTGSVFQAIRENEERAQAIGYNVTRYKLLAITVAGMLAGLAGIIHGILNKSANPTMMGVNYTVEALLMTIIGGVGTFTGPVIGASGFHLAETLFRDVDLTIFFALIGQDTSIEILNLNISQNWLLILGVIFVVVVIVFPFGIVGTYRRWRARRKQ